jgi:hypothetical protein
MLRKLIRDEAPDYLLVVFDARGDHFRHRLYDGYKATRDAQPEDLSAQIPIVRELVQAHRIPLLEVEDFEADDVIATLVRRAPADAQIAIVSTDKDLMQLVGGRVVLIDGIKERRYDEKAVEERFGVPPSQLLDLRALAGDPSDNIPGVKGIGAKGAAELIREWGDLESLLAHAAEVPSKRAREALLAQIDQARLSKQLATLHDDVPLPLALGPRRAAAGSRAAARACTAARVLAPARPAPERGRSRAAGTSAPRCAASGIAGRCARRQLRALPRSRSCRLRRGRADGRLARGPRAFAQGPARRRACARGRRTSPRASSPGGRRPAAHALRGQGRAAVIGARTSPCRCGSGAVLGSPRRRDVELAAQLLIRAARAQSGSSPLGARADAATGRRAGASARARPAGGLAAAPDRRLGGCAGLRRAALEASLAGARRTGMDALPHSGASSRACSRMERAPACIDETALSQLSGLHPACRAQAHIHALAGERFLINSPKRLQRICSRS